MRLYLLKGNSKVWVGESCMCRDRRKVEDTGRDKWRNWRLEWQKLRACAKQTVVSDEPWEGGRVHMFPKFLGHVIDLVFNPKTHVHQMPLNVSLMMCFGGCTFLYYSQVPIIRATDLPATSVLFCLQSVIYDWLRSNSSLILSKYCQNSPSLGTGLLVALSFSRFLGV